MTEQAMKELYERCCQQFLGHDDAQWETQSFEDDVIVQCAVCPMCQTEYSRVYVPVSIRRVLDPGKKGGLEIVTVEDLRPKVTVIVGGGLVQDVRQEPYDGARVFVEDYDVGTANEEELQQGQDGLCYKTAW